MESIPPTMNVTESQPAGDIVQHSRQPYQIAVTSVVLALAIPAVVLRLWVRKHMINSLGGDDYMMSIALLTFIMYGVAVWGIVANGGGTHIRGDQTRVANAWLIVNEVFYLLTQIFMKLALGLFFLRVVIRKNQRRFILGLVTFCAIINTYHIIFVIFRCGDPKRLVESPMNEKCVSNRVSIALAYEQAAVSTVTDIIFAALPIPLLWSATMDRRSKISAGLILSLGAFGSICSIVRFRYVQYLSIDDDFFYSAVNISIWSTIELGAGIIAGSLAAMRPLLKRMLKIGRDQITLHTRGGGNRTDKNKLQTSKSSATKLSKQQPILDIESLPSVFRPWESVGESGGFTTTVEGGRDVEKEIKSSMNNTMNKSVDIMSSIDHANRAAIWPFMEDKGGIAKVVDVTVSVSQAGSPVSTEPSPSSAMTSKSWHKRFEDLVRKPERSHVNTQNTVGSIHNLQFSPITTNANTRLNSRNNTHLDTRSSTPEWERIPDLVLMEQLSRRETPVTPSTEEKSEASSNKSPKSGSSDGPQRSPSR